MEKIIEFLDNYYSKAQKLSNDFSMTRDFEWTSLVILNELAVQLGHIYNIIYQNEAINEPGRIFNNLGDELSDVFLQLVALADSMSIDMYHIRSLKNIDENNWFALPVLFGQLNEAVMEKFGYRFNKPRNGFQTTDQFIEDRILRMFCVTYKIAVKYDLDIEKEFQLMLDDANGFLKRFVKKGKKTEYIDTYNEKHEFIDRFEKGKAHRLGLWHDTFGVLIFNPRTKKVFFQLKNHLHNNVCLSDLLEITAGGHLQAGEKIEDGIREVYEETGLEISFKSLIKCYTRNCDIDNGMVIREFQHYYILPLDIDINDLRMDNDEVIGFIEIDLENCENIIKNNSYSLGILKTSEEILKKKVTKNYFDEAFVNNGVFEKLLNKVIEYTKNYKGDR